MRMAKHSLDEFEEVSEVSRPSPSAKIHAVVNSLSPMKSKTCSYFDGQITDGKATMRVFGFDSDVRRKLVEFEDSKNAVALTNCEVKRSRKGEELEVLVTKKTVEEATEFGIGLMKQDILVADSTGIARLAVWEKEIGKLDKDASYRLSGVMVCEFRGKKFLSTSKELSNNSCDKRSWRRGGGAK